MYAESVTAAPAAIVQNVLDDELRTPQDIFEDLKLVEVIHWNFSGEEQVGQIVMHSIAVPATLAYYRRAHAIQFPIHSIRPVHLYQWDDEKSLAGNNSSGHNMRRIDDGSGRWSLHAIGVASDTNPMQNPCIVFDEAGTESHRLPAAGRYREGALGTLSEDHALVKLMEDYGFVWGGTWTTLKDYQHFQMDREILPDHLAKYVNT